MSTSAGRSTSATPLGVGAARAIMPPAGAPEVVRALGLVVEMGAPRSGADLDVPVDLSNLVDVQWLGRGAVDHGARGDVEAGAVALAHERRSGEQPSGQRARLVCAGAEIVEGVQQALDPRDRDPELDLAQVVGNDQRV